MGIVTYIEARLSSHLLADLDARQLAEACASYGMTSILRRDSPTWAVERAVWCYVRFPFHSSCGRDVRPTPDEPSFKTRRLADLPLRKFGWLRDQRKLFRRKKFKLRGPATYRIYWELDSGLSLSAPLKRNSVYSRDLRARTSSGAPFA